MRTKAPPCRFPKETGAIARARAAPSSPEPDGGGRRQGKISDSPNGLRVDWHQLFGFTLSPWEIMLRGTVMYLGLFVLFRVIIRRRVGAVGMADILILVIVADAAQNGMAGEYKSITEGLLLVLTILGWNVLIDWLTYRFPALQGVLEPPPLLLIDRGRILRRNLRHEFIAESELYAKLREQGVTDPSEVERAYIEADGQVTVIKKK